MSNAAGGAVSLLLVLALLAGGAGAMSIILFYALCLRSHLNDALRWAAENGHLPVVEFLVARGADIHADNERALFRAAQVGHLPVVEFLRRVRKEVRKEARRAEIIISHLGRLTRARRQSK